MNFHIAFRVKLFLLFFFFLFGLHFCLHQCVSSGLCISPRTSELLSHFRKKWNVPQDSLKNTTFLAML